MLKKPEYLYKYHSAKRVTQILTDLTFYFAPVSQLNDLYEFRARSLYTEKADSRDRVYAKYLVRNTFFDREEEALRAIPNLNKDSEASDTYKFFLNALNAVLSNIMNHSGVTCFSAHRNDQRMWGSYADNHAGAVIEFTTSSDASRFSSHLMPVLYLGEKLDLCPSEFLTDRFELDQRLCGALCCIKSLSWRDEAEWRLLLLTNEEQTREQRVEPFERSAITRVFLGPRILPQDEAAIRKAACAHTPEIPVFKRKIDEHEAREEPVGFEIVNSFEQLLYWVKRFQ